jgi:eukaryotic-like serine/threonine-protein kinase
MDQPAPGMLVTPTVRLVRSMSGGAMGSVWLAEHTGLETQVVVKFIAADVAASPDVVARFKREAAAASRVKSPHVVQMLDHGVTESGLPYIIMELLEGRDLQQRIREQRKLPVGEVAVIIAQLGKALARAHERGVLHRDIKPSNIFLCDVGNNELFVKLLDFGVAKTANGPDLDTTKAGQILGTPFFMSPEALAGANVDHRSDLWALGVLAFMLLTGKRPFRGDSISALTLAIHVNELPRAREFEPTLPLGFDDWFKKSCAREPDQRFQSARELAEALFSALEVRDSVNVSATGSLPAMITADGAPADAPSVPGLNASAYNYATSAEMAPRRGRRAIIAAAVALLTVVIGIAVMRTRATPEPAPAAPASPKVEAPLEKPAATPTPSVTASVDPPAVASTSKPAVKMKPKSSAQPAAAKPADDPFGDSRH